MHVHVLGICGAFMAGLATLAREQGLTVSGSDAAAYPPMSVQLERLGIEVRDDERQGAVESGLELQRVSEILRHLCQQGESPSDVVGVKAGFAVFVECLVHVARILHELALNSQCVTARYCELDGAERAEVSCHRISGFHQ